MVRVHILVEGETEEKFVNEVLLPYFAQYQTYLFPRKLGKSQHKRGICKYPLAQRDILTTLKQETQAFCTTMFDYYRMPPDWPKRDEAKRKALAKDKGIMVENAILEDISHQLGVKFNCSRFIPYVQMHEFEALLFSDPKLLADGLELPDCSAVQTIREQFQSPEEINDSEQTAPSKQIIGLKADYDKKDDGILISQKIGLPAMRAHCPHFNAWIEKLEALAGR